LAEYILGNTLRKLAREHGLVRVLLWRLDFAMIWLLIKLFASLPVDTASRLGDRLGRVIGPRLVRKTAIFKENLGIAFPQLDESGLQDLVERAWGRAGRVLAEYPHLAAIGADNDRIVIDIQQDVETCRNPERPCVFISSHQSNWEILPVAMARLGIPSAVLYTPPTNPLLNQMLLNSRQALNCELLPRDASVRSLMQAFKRGRSIGMIADRRVDEGNPVCFFGRDKLTTLVPARLALKLNCDLIPTHVERLGDACFRVTLHPPLVADAPDADLTAQAIDMTGKAHQLFEEWARQSPQDWFCTKRLWAKPQKNAVNGHAAAVEVSSRAA
jgi:KDO2-lipid IV(A) lauroyltransferase